MTVPTWEPDIRKLPDGRYEVESASRRGEYHLIERKGGGVVCGCQDFWYRQRPQGGICRHQRELGEWLVRQVGR